MPVIAHSRITGIAMTKKRLGASVAAANIGRRITYGDTIAQRMQPPLGSLNRKQRDRDLEAIDAGETLDLLVIGGGVTGAGIALDAATRGLSVALVERRDLASGTSRQSSKLIHGGLRYLRHGEVGLAWESARERHILMSRTAPHLV